MFPRRFFSTVPTPCVSSTVTRNNIGVITFQRPEAKNAISFDFLKQFQSAIRALDENRSVRAVLLRSSVPKVFCAGADLKERRSMSTDAVRSFVRDLRSTTLSLSKIEVPTIACINGAALGGGLEFALGCDFRVMSSKSVVGLPETSLGIIPGAGGTVFLPRVVGPQIAKYLIFTGIRVHPQRAVKMGIADFAEEVNESLLTDGQSPSMQPDMEDMVLQKGGDRSVELALHLAHQMIKNGPLALRMAKSALLSDKSDLVSRLEAEDACYETVLKSADRLEALEAFANKRLPIFKGV